VWWVTQWLEEMHRRVQTDLERTDEVANVSINVPKVGRHIGNIGETETQERQRLQSEDHSI